MNRTQKHYVLENYSAIEGFGRKEEAKSFAAKIRGLGHKALVMYGGGCYNVYARRASDSKIHYYDGSLVREICDSCAGKPIDFGSCLCPDRKFR